MTVELAINSTIGVNIAELEEKELILPV